MGSGGEHARRNDAPGKAEGGPGTSSIDDDEPDRKPPYIGTYLYSDHEDEDDARYALANQRGPGLWLPLVIFVVLLIAAALISRDVWSPTVSVLGTPAPAGSSAPPASGGVGPPGTGTGPAIPTPPSRPADALAGWAGLVSAEVDIPATAVEAYGYAQMVLHRTDPGCHVGWTTLAGIGEATSRHGRAGGATLQENGRSMPTVVGPLLNGQSGQPLVADTDAGAFDGDATFDRAMGPLLVLPSVWKAHQADADNDGILDPYDIDDAALAVAMMLCSGDEDLQQLAGWRTAVGRHTSGESFANAVFTAADSYGQRTARIQ